MIERAAGLLGLALLSACGIVNGLNGPGDGAGEGEGEEGEGEGEARLEGCFDGLLDEGNVIGIGGSDTRLYLPPGGIEATAVLVPDFGPARWTEGDNFLCFLVNAGYAVISLDDDAANADDGAANLLEALQHHAENFGEAHQARSVVFVASIAPRYPPVAFAAGVPVAGPSHVVMLSAAPGYTGDAATVKAQMAETKTLWMTADLDTACDGDCPAAHAAFGPPTANGSFEVSAATTTTTARPSWPGSSRARAQAPRPGSASSPSSRSERGPASLSAPRCRQTALAASALARWSEIGATEIAALP